MTTTDDAGIPALGASKSNIEDGFVLRGAADGLKFGEPVTWVLDLLGVDLADGELEHVQMMAHCGGGLCR